MMLNLILQPSCVHIRIGREPAAPEIAGCEVLALAGERVSRQHLDIWLTNDIWYASDLGTTNGTFLLGQSQRLPGKSPIPLPGDRESRFFLGGYLLVFNPATMRINAHELGASALLEVRGITVEKPGEQGPKRILQDVSFTAFPGRVTAIMGGSGTGKSTLLKAINGYEAPCQGEVRLNEKDLYATPELRRDIGYLPQEDVFHEDLSIREILDFTLRIRMPELGPDGRESRIQAAIAAVALQEVAADARHARVMSGGQRKRLGIAMELLAEPKVLFLDEPTSGLSSEDSFDLLATLREIAETRGTCVLMVIHQPSLDAYRQLHDLIVLKRDPGTPATLVYAGPAFPDALTYFQAGLAPGTMDTKYGGHPDPGIILLATEGSRAKGSLGWDLKSWLTRWVHSGYGALHQQIPTSMVPEDLPPLRPFGLGQFAVLIARDLRLKLRDKRALALVFLQPILIAFALAVALGRFDATRDALHFNHLFFMMFSALWCGASNPPTEIVGERKILNRERQVNLKIPSYTFAKLTTFGLLSVIQVTLLVTILVPAWGLKGNPVAIFGLLLLVTLCGNALGLLLSAAATTAEFAVSLVPIPLVVMLLFAGGPIRRLPSMTKPVVTMTTLMPSRWGFEGMVHLEAKGHGQMANPWHDAFFNGPLPDDSVPDFGRGVPLTVCILALLAWYSAMVGALLALLRRQLVH